MLSLCVGNLWAFFFVLTLCGWFSFCICTECGSGLRGGALRAVGGEDGSLAVGEANGDIVAGVVDDRLRLLRGGDDVVVLVTGQVQVVEGIAVHHGGADILQHTDDFVLTRQGQIGVIGGYQTLLRQDAAVVGLTLGHRVAGGHDLVLADVDHGVHLHQLGGVLQRHEIRGLVGDIQQQGEGGGVFHLLDLPLGAVHGGVLLGAGHQIEPRFLRALVGQDKANVGLVGHHGGDAGVHVHVVTDGDVVVALGGDGHVPLAEQGIDEAVDIRAVVIILLHDQFGGVDVIHPVGHVAGLVVGALAGDGVHQHGTDDITAAEQTDGVADTGPTTKTTSCRPPSN